MKNNNVVSKEVALDDLERFVNKFLKKPLEKSELEKTYPDVLEAITDGYLEIDQESSMPKYTLKFPIKDAENTTVVLDKISFRTRIKPTQLADLAKGLHPQTEVFTLQLRMTAYIIEQPVAMLDKFERYDYDCINQIASVFT